MRRQSFSYPDQQRLLIKILYKIEKEKELRRLSVQLFLSFTGFLFTLSFFSSAVSLLSKKALEGGFASYLFLVRSDFNIVLIEWQNFLWALLESLPVLELASVFIVLSLLILASMEVILLAKRFFKELKLNGVLKHG